MRNQLLGRTRSSLAVDRLETGEEIEKSQLKPSFAYVDSYATKSHSFKPQPTFTVGKVSNPVKLFFGRFSKVAKCFSPRLEQVSAQRFALKRQKTRLRLA